MTENRIALITGGGRGIGREIAQQLASEGIIVCVASRTQAEIDETVDSITSEGNMAHGFSVDVTDDRALEELVETIRTTIGPIDILINNAGIGYGGKPLWESDIDAIWKVMQVNFKAPLKLSSLVIPSMIERNSGTIVNMSSFAAIRQLPGASAYGISKTALTRLSETLAVELEGTDISVYSISPGLVLTDMTRDIPVFKDVPKSQWTPIEEPAKLVLKLISGKYKKLSGRFIHISYDIDEMLDNAGKIEEDNLYTLSLPTLNGIES